MDLQFAVVGSGEKWCEDELAALSARLPNFKARIGFDERLAHLVEAGSDFFLMPSRYEPCGLNQMYSLRYGTLPIVHRTGGLSDTVENYNQETGAGTGLHVRQPHAQGGLRHRRLGGLGMVQQARAHHGHAREGDGAGASPGSIRPPNTPSSTSAPWSSARRSVDTAARSLGRPEGR